MVSAIRIVPVALDLRWSDQNVLPVFPAPRVDVAADVLDFGRIAIRIVAAAPGRIVRHVPCRIELLVPSFILRGMAVLRRCGGDHKDEADCETGPSHVSLSSSGTAPARATIAPPANGDRQ
jgi:hypothetical protein